jgi:Rod binding domain-containing protein
MDQMPAVSVAIPDLGMDVSSLTAQAAHGAPAQRTAAAAAGFESVLLSLLVKEMRQTLEPNTLFGQDSGDICGGLFDFYLGQHLARSGGVGIAAMIRKQLEAPARR